jgi:hypothetical protein
MLQTLSVARRYRLNGGYPIPFRIKLGMIGSTFEKRVGDAVGIFWNSGTDLDCRLVRDVAHGKSIALELHTVGAKQGAFLSGLSRLGVTR